MLCFQIYFVEIFDNTDILLWFFDKFSNELIHAILFQYWPNGKWPKLKGLRKELVLNINH